MEDTKTGSETLMIKGRHSLVLDTVKNILGFDESYVNVAIEEGRVVIEGSELKIESLTKNDGKLIVEGKISGVYYNDTSSVKKSLGKWFK